MATRPSSGCTMLMPTMSGSVEASSKPQTSCTKDLLRRQGAQHLVEEADLKIAGWRCSSCAAMLQLATVALAFIELRALRGQVFR